MIHKLKAWLVKNHLSQDQSDYVAVVDTNGNIDVNGIVDELVAEGMELKRETAIDVISRYNRKVIDLALSGYNVNTGLVHMRTTVKGVFYDKKWDSERNRLHVSISQGTDLRKAVAETSVEILGEKGEMIAIFNITDMSTGKTDGTVTRSFNIDIKGTNIKIFGDSPETGVYINNTETGEEYKFSPINIVINDPSRLMLLLPANIATGHYEMRICTQFTQNGRQLKTTRTAILSTILTVV
ncbi:MAG: DUF4469 domain-containing protein [Prevotellaceae bacterium]|jgi:hypothetical protein|nr:DUF4469 domain-containing protein [Prevotellaceae bacterium]